MIRRIASLDIMRASRISEHYRIVGLKRVGLYYAERRQSCQAANTGFSIIEVMNGLLNNGLLYKYRDD